MEQYLTLISVPAIAAVVYWLINLIKYTTKNNAKVLTFIPLIAGVLGIICGLIAFYAVPGTVPTDNVIVAMLIGGASGLSAVGFNQVIKQIEKSKKN